MKVISAIYNEQKNAGPKAPSDINRILYNQYGAKISSIVRTGMFRFKVLFKFIQLFFCTDIIVLQHPLLLRSYAYKILPKKKTIILIHDIMGLRNQNDFILNHEINILKSFKYIIVHNSKMKDYLISKGILSNNIYSLELFDYLANGQVNENYEFDKKNLTLIYPGNLKEEKSPFIYQLDSKKINYKINLYGLGITTNISDKLIYKGSFEPDDINYLEGDIGLIWDGNYDDSDESIGFKNYAKYINPHKLSCCVAMGVPVIVWKKSALAEFVEKHNIGYTINNLYDINNLDFCEYDIKRKNAIKLGKQVRKGYFTVKAINQIIKRIEKNK